MPMPAEAAADVKPVSNPHHKWYIVQAYSNFEKKAAEHIRDQAKAQGLEDCFSEILVPTEDVVEVRRGRKINAERKFFPGYVLVKMELSDEAYHLIKNTPKVTGFLGSGSKPMPVSEKEVQRIVGAIEEGVERPRPTISFEIGENVRVTDGPFASFNGSVEQVDEERTRLRVTVSIFGRATPVELEYSQVEKVV
jgi:transcriptional antiterminator NusG